MRGLGKVFILTLCSVVALLQAVSVLPKYVTGSPVAAGHAAAASLDGRALHSSLPDKRPLLNSEALSAPTHPITPYLPSAPVTAESKLLVVCVSFKDKPATQPISVYQQLYFGLRNSVANYYRTVSYGDFRLTGDVVGDPTHPTHFLALPHTESYYAGKDNGSGSGYPHNTDGLVHDVISRLVTDHFDFAPYVYHGQIPYLAIVFSGYGADVDSNNASLIWPVENTLQTPMMVPVASHSGTKDTTAQVMNYDVVPELDDQSGVPSTLGVLAHEFGHLLGLDDLYDTSSSSRAGQGDGPWSIMAQGNWNGTPQGSSPAELDPFSRIFLGWVKPILISRSVTGLVLPPIEDAPVVYELVPKGSQSDYFLIDNVQHISYDNGLPETGILIWHVDGLQANPVSSDWVNNVLNTPSQNKTGRYDLQVVEAGNTSDLTQPTDSVDTYDDTYPSAQGNNQFTAHSKPNNDTFRGTPLGIDVVNMAINQKGNATFDVLDQQSGDTLTISRPLQGLTVYQGQTLPLSAHMLIGRSNEDVSQDASWTATHGVVLKGDAATFSEPGSIAISASAFGLDATLNLTVIGLRVLKAEPNVMTWFSRVKEPLVLPVVHAVYDDGKVMNVTRFVTWHVVGPSTLTITKGKLSMATPPSGNLTLVGIFAGQSIKVMIQKRA